MAMTIVPIEQRAVWESFLLAHQPAALFQSWAWGEVQARLKVHVERWGIRDGEKLVGIAQICTVKAKRGTFLHLRHGPVLVKYSKATLAALIRHFIEHRGNALFLRISPLIEPNEHNTQLLHSLGFRPSPIHAMDAELCWILDLELSEDSLMAGMRKSTRYEIRRASGLGVEITRSQSLSDFAHFAPLYEHTASRHGFVGHSGVREEFELFAKENLATLYLAKHEGKVLAGAIILYWGNQAIYHHGASVYSKIPASHILQWEAIRDAKKRGMKVYNFWGIAPEDNPKHPWRGITLFKKGFGGREMRYMHAHDLPLSPLYVIPRTVETVRRVLKGY